MQDYTGNSKTDKEKSKTQSEKVSEKEKIEKVVSSEVVVKKKSLGQKIRHLIVEADFRSVSRYVISDVFIPAVKNMIVESVNRGAERMMYGESAIRQRRYGIGPSRITYDSPFRPRNYRDIQSAARQTQSSLPRSSRSGEDTLLLTTREDAEVVIERLHDILDRYEAVSVADLNNLIGHPSSHVDNKWGWFALGDVRIQQTRDGFLIDLPPAEPI